MRKKAALAAAFGLLALMGAMPGMMLGRVERCPVVSPRLASYRPSVRCEGQVWPAEGYQLLSAGLYLVEERYRSLGETVGKGEALAALVPAAGEAVLYLQTQGSGLSQGADGTGLESLLKGRIGTDAQPDLDWAALRTVETATGEGERVLATSPAAGVVTQEAPVPGSVVKPGAVIAAVEGREEFFALLTVGEKDAGKISVGNAAVLSGEGVGLGSCQGWVTRIRPGTRKELNGTAAQNVVDIEVSIQPEDCEGLEIRPGFSVKAQIFTDEERQIMMVPYESIRQDLDNTEYVMVAGRYRIEKRPVTTGRETADGVEILEGLRPGELVSLLPDQVREQGRGRYLLVYAEGG